MKNILMFAGVAGIAAAIAIYFVSEDMKSSAGMKNIKGAAKDAYDTMNKHIGNVERSTERGFNAMG